MAFLSTIRCRLVPLTVALLATAFTSTAGGVTVRVTPTTIFVGEPARFEIISEAGKPELMEIPQIGAIQWNMNSASSGIQIRNFDRTDTLSYTFTVTQTGTYVIPPLKIRAGGTIYSSDPIRVQVTERQIVDQGKTLTYDDLIHLQVLYDGKEAPPAKMYLGEELELAITLLVDERLQIAQDRFNQANNFLNPANYFPTMTLNNALFRDYSQQNPHNGKFLYQDGRHQIIKGNRYTVFRYTARISGIEAGRIHGTIAHVVPVLAPDQDNRRSNDPFGRMFNNEFFSMARGGSRVSHQRVAVTMAPVTVEAIPADATKDGYFLGLIGEWDIQVAVDYAQVLVGEDLTLTLTATGNGNVEPLLAPNLELPGFRIYPPEVTRESGAASTGTIRWVLIPLNEQSRLPKLIFKTFNTADRNYRRHEFRPELIVKPSETTRNSAATVEDYSVHPIDVTSAARDTRRATNILYIKTKNPTYVATPLWQNHKYVSIALAALGPLACGVLCFLAARREKTAGDDVYRRRRAAMRKRGRVFRALRRATADELPGVVREELFPFLVAMLRLPPGTTNSELLTRLDDPELKVLLQQFEAHGFMPGGTGKLDPKILLQRVKKIAVLVTACLLSLPSVAGASMQDAATAYDQDHIGQAEAIYRGLDRTGFASPELLFNLGNCAYRRGENGLAIVFYEKARRLAPRDTDITENLNFVRTQLNLPPIQPTDNPLVIIRSWIGKLRPDEWILVAATAWCLAWLLAGIARWRQNSIGFAPLALGALCVLAVWAGLWVKHTTYTRNQAVVVRHASPLYRLPVDTVEEKAKQVLDAGEYVHVVEQRADWSRIRIDEAEGWIRNNAIVRIW